MRVSMVQNLITNMKKKAVEKMQLKKAILKENPVLYAEIVCTLTQDTKISAKIAVHC